MFCDWFLCVHVYERSQYYSSSANLCLPIIPKVYVWPSNCLYMVALLHTGVNGSRPFFLVCVRKSCSLNIQRGIGKRSFDGGCHGDGGNPSINIAVVKWPNFEEPFYSSANVKAIQKGMMRNRQLMRMSLLYTIEFITKKKCDNL